MTYNPIICHIDIVCQYMKDKFQIFSERLKTERIANKYTQKQMAEMLGTTQAVYNRYEKGGSIQGREPDFEILCKLAKILGVSADYLLDLED